MSQQLRIGMPVWVIKLTNEVGEVISRADAEKAKRLAVITNGMWTDDAGAIKNFWSWEYYTPLTGIPNGIAQSGYDNGEPFAIVPATEYRTRIFLERIPK